jgi:hypothetical protein
MAKNAGGWPTRRRMAKADGWAEAARTRMRAESAYDEPALDADPAAAGVRKSTAWSRTISMQPIFWQR